MRTDIFGIAKQSAMGTKQTTMEYFPLVESVEVTHNRPDMSTEETTGTRHPSGIDYGAEFWTIVQRAYVRIDHFPRVLSAFWGAPTTTTVDTTAKKHAFGSGSPIPHSMFVVRKDMTPAIVDLFWDCLGDTLELEVDGNGFLRYTATYIARMLDDTQAAPSPTYDNSARFSFDQAKVHASVDGGGEAEVKVARWSSSYGNAIDTDEVILGQRQLYAIGEQNSSYETRYSPREALSTHYRRALQSDPAKVALRCIAEGAVIGATTAKQTFEQKVFACETLDAPAALSAADKLKMIEVSARGRYDHAAAKFVETYVQNLVASY